MDDDIMPNDGAFVVREPADQVKERTEEKGRVLAGKKEIKKVIEHFEERIKFRDSIDAITVELENDPAMFQKVLEVNKLLKLGLTEEKQMLEELLDTYDIT